MQECPNGLVDEETFLLIYAHFFPQGDSSQYARHVFRTFDGSRRGAVTFEEFLEGLSTLARGTFDEKLRWVFELYDIKRDGVITKDELTQIILAIYEMLGASVQVMFFFNVTANEFQLSHPSSSDFLLYQGGIWLKPQV